ncbi:endonuclease MutS2 [Falseniella ignava]|uniref:Endonuclease MutS2 n=1 Tax=Falseniella ignava CCUG 37419 TaxID=883112 RepID=K1M3H1_9LACT|nr:endonuclease MutS2 [Falseniella ignava]EKB56928.1 MutS2 family protein [Falseniella ignava CCUG 37419]
MFDQKILKTLDYHKIKQQLIERVQTEMGHQFVSDQLPQTKQETIQRLLDETEEVVRILSLPATLPIPRISNVRESIKRVEIGARLNGKELAELGKLLSTTSQLVRFFSQLEENNQFFPQLNEWVQKIVSLPEIEQRIDQTVDSDGIILDTASSELNRIRRAQLRTEQSIRETLNTIIKSKANLLSDTLITIRNQRYVIPVKTDYRAQFKGTVYDQSSTGQTLFIEPQSVTNLNNQLAALRSEEKVEVDRILDEVTEQLLPYLSEINQNHYALGYLDYVQARAEYSLAIEGTKPTLSPEREVRIWQARHPLIDPKQIVANDILIGGDYQSLIITGPNTGGKTILLKTLGMLQIMGQSGLYIPAEEASQIGIFDQVYADIGDEQSIEQNLSTFSSHMTNIVSIIQRATYQSLILLDELGSGTDPQEGAALAMAILDYFQSVGSIVLATTHYPELKVYANHAANTQNASMEFNDQTLSPTYRLLIGIPGRSNALEISKRLGLRSDIIEKAQSGVQQESQQLNDMVMQLDQERREMEEEHQQTQRYLDDAQTLLDRLKDEYQQWLNAKEDLMAQAKREANQYIEAKKEEAEKIISDIRDLQLEQSSQQPIKEHTFIENKKRLGDLTEPERLKKNKVLQRAKKQQRIEVGDEVEVLAYQQRGTIVEIPSSKEYIVQMGVMKMKVAASEVKLLESVEPQRRLNVQRHAGSKVSTSLDLRGERFDAALRRLSQYLDQALLSNHPMVTIIHGKGTGALRKGVQQALANHPQVERFEYSPPNAGGDGSTIVYFKG